MEIQLLMLLLSLSTLCFFIHAGESSPSLAKPHCPSKCGSIDIPYPFGIGPGCYRNYGSVYDRGFEILCDNSTDPPKPFLKISDTSRPEVLDISLSGTLRINNPIFFSGCPYKTNHSQLPDLWVSPFTVSEKNKFTSVSCGRIATLKSSFDALGIVCPTQNQNDPEHTCESSHDYTNMAVCLSICGENGDDYTNVMANHTCDGINCCQTSIRTATYGVLDTSFGPLIDHSGSSERSSCNYAFLVDPDWFTSDSTNTSTIFDMDYVPMLLTWRLYSEDGSGGVDNSTEDNMNRNCDSDMGPCSCAKGYNGNPYLRGGCQDIDECKDRPGICDPWNCSNKPGNYSCDVPPDLHIRHRRLSPIKLVIIVLCSVFGLIFANIGTWWLHKVVKTKNKERRKQKFYIQNGGLLLESLLTSGEINVEKIKLFDAKDLENATNRFNVDRILGEGGQGTVYKGMLIDGRIVAVKKSKIIDWGDVSQFINEIVILSQINHRNVVKMLGCCLESEVPLLVYEFLPNGTLSQYIQSRDADFPLTWDVRLQISLEVAGALSYLHSSISMPIYHRDIKSSNILLDEMYRAKVADFGTSRSVSIDKTHLTMTSVNGTFGYLDPEYFRSSQFTDKSDVYSFGVVLAELLTGHKPITITRLEDGTQEARSLAIYFIASMEENVLFDILDPEVIQRGKTDEIMVVANLTKRCLNLEGKKRPTMKEVAAELEAILISRMSSEDFDHIAEIEHPPLKSTEVWDSTSISTESH